MDKNNPKINEMPKKLNNTINIHSKAVDKSLEIINNINNSLRSEQPKETKKSFMNENNDNPKINEMPDKLNNTINIHSKAVDKSLEIENKINNSIRREQPKETIKSFMNENNDNPKINEMPDKLNKTFNIQSKAVDKSLEITNKINNSIRSEQPKETKKTIMYENNDKLKINEMPDKLNNTVNIQSRIMGNSLEIENKINNSIRNEQPEILNKTVNFQSKKIDKSFQITNKINNSLRSEQPKETKKSNIYENKSNNEVDNSNINEMSLDNSLISKNLSEYTFIEIDCNSFKNKYLCKSNYIFDLFSGILNYKNEDIEDDEEVFLLVIKIIDYDSIPLKKIKSFIDNSLEDYNRNFKHFFLKRIGYCNIANKFCLIYEKSNTSLFNFDTLKITDLKDINQLTKVIYCFQSLVNNLNICHENGLRISLIHNDLLFFNKKGIKMIDFIFSKLFYEYDFNSNLDIALYFGYYGKTEVNELFRGFCDNKLLYKNDVILLTLTMNYLFSNNSSYCNFIYELEKDFILENKSFENFLINNQVEEIKSFISEILNINYKEIHLMKVAQVNFEKIVKKMIGKIKCEQSKCKYSSKFMCYNCFQFMCKSCSKDHKCLIQKESNKGKLYIEYKNKLSELKNLAYNMNIPRLKFFNYFKTNVNPTFKKIKNLHKKFEIFIRNNEDKLKEEIRVLVAILEKKNYNEHKNILNFRDKLQNDLKAIIDEVQKKLQGKTDEKENDKVKLNESQSSNRKKSIYDGILDKNIKNDKYINSFNELKEQIENYEKFKDSDKDLRTELNYNLNLNFIVDKIYGKSLIFLEKFITLYLPNILDQNNEFSKILIDAYNSFDLIDNSNILNELKTKDNYCIGTVDLKQNLVILYDILASNDINIERKIMLNFQENIVPKYIIPLCRWVNLKNRLIISGGIFKTQLGREVISKSAYYIYFDLENESNTRNVIKLPDMLNERDQHCFISINDFFLLSIGGSRTSTCEEFNFFTNKWTYLPSLDSPRYNCSAYIHNSVEVYLFFGLIGPPLDKKLIFSDSILRLKFFKSSKSDSFWENIIYIGEKINVCLNGIVSLSNNTVLITGGRIAGDNNYSNLNFSFDPESLIIMSSETILEKKLCFLESNFLKTNKEDFNYVLYSSDFNLIKLKF